MDFKRVTRLTEPYNISTGHSATKVRGDFADDRQGPAKNLQKKKRNTL